jgi:hypothetical protein
VVVVVALMVVVAVLALWRFTGTKPIEGNTAMPEDPMAGEDPQLAAAAGAEGPEEIGMDAEYGPGVPECGR